MLITGELPIRGFVEQLNTVWISLPMASIGASITGHLGPGWLSWLSCLETLAIGIQES